MLANVFDPGMKLTSRHCDCHIFLHTDMGESTSHKIIDYLNTVGISLKTTCPHTPEQNMVIERVWRTIGESAIAMLLTAELSESYWEEARKTACYVYNRSPGAHEDVSPISPYQQYYGIVPHVSHLQIFGTKCYAKNPVKDKGNHEQKAWPGIFVGFQDQQPIGWRVYLPESDDFLITAHATFEDHRVSKPSTEIGVSGSSRYTTEELSSVRLDNNTDVAVKGAERGSKSHSLGR